MHLGLSSRSWISKARLAERVIALGRAPACLGLRMFTHIQLWEVRFGPRADLRFALPGRSKHTGFTRGLLHVCMSVNRCVWVYGPGCVCVCI